MTGKKLILHIPHSSTHFPFMEGFTIDRDTLENEINKLTDWYTDDIFYSEYDETIKAEFSRIFCDTERFTNDEIEPMAKVGMGVLYEKSDEGETIRKITSDLRRRILNDYYETHHQRLSEAVNKQLHSFGKALIIDCHSYPSHPLKRDLHQEPNRPDFNIGIDLMHTPDHLIDLCTSFFDKHGYSLGIDWPYSGTIVPLEHFQKNNRVQSIMLEINRNLYLNEPTNEKSKSYEQVKSITQAFINLMRQTL